MSGVQSVSGDVISPPMTRKEASDCVAEIKRNIESAWRLILDLHDRRGWETLGYKNWRECMAAEFDVKQAHAYRLLQAANVNKAIVDSGAPPIPETHARALAPLANKPEEVRRVHRDVQTKTNGKPKAVDYQQAVHGDSKPTLSSPASVIDTLMRKAHTLDSDGIAVTLMKAGRTPDDARSVSRWFVALAASMEQHG